MNKLFSKLGSLLLGASLIVAGGVSLSSKGVSEAKAAEQLYYTLDGTITGGSSGYASESDITQGSLNWKATGNTTISPWRIGGNSLNGVERPIYSTTAMNETITKIDLTLGTGSGITLDSFSLIIASDAAFSSVIETIITKPTINAKTTYTPGSGKTWENAFYKFIFTVTVTGTSNKYIQFSKAEFYREVSTPIGELSISNPNKAVIEKSETPVSLGYTFTPASGGATSLASHEWTSSDTEVASVSGDTLSTLKAGRTRLALTATDTLGVDYSTYLDVFISEPIDFVVGDNLAFYAANASVELSGIEGGSTKYGAVTAFSGSAVGAFALTLGEGAVNSSYSFENNGSYLFWKSGNSLNTQANVDESASWYIVNFGDYYEVINSQDYARSIFYNPGSSTVAARFATYSSFGSSYEHLSIAKLEEVPLRGSIEITGPVDKTMRADASGDLTYQWTPNEEATDVVISSHTWTSSNPEVIAVDGDTYQAVGAGKAKLTLNATDSTGQEYTVVGNEIEVISVVSGDYIKKMSVAIGDIVTLVCEADGTQIGGIDSNIGTYVFYNSKPASVFDFVLEAGSADNSYAFKTGDNKYLAWSSDAKVALVDEVNEKASWTISFNDIGDATIQCVALDGDAGRQIMWNHNSPRFAAYKNGQTAIQLYGQVVEPVVPYDATNFAQDLINLTNEQCSEYGTDSYDYETSKDKFATLWETLSGDSYYGKLSDEDILLLEQADAKEDSEDVLEVAMYRYDLITAKYSLDSFIGTRVVPTFSFIHDYESSVSSSNTIGIVVIVAVSSMTLLGLTLVIRKRKHQ